MDVFRGKKIWVSGHTGFKGSILTQWLLQLGAKVSGYALAPETTPDLYSLLRIEDRMASTFSDVRDGQTLRDHMAGFRPEIVFHLAAQPLVRKSYEDPSCTFATNVQGTVNVMEAIRGVGSVRAAVIVTTDKCYENSGRGEAFRETDRLGGNDPYSASKACAELVVASYRQSFFQTPGGTNIASARAGNVIGGGDWSRDRLLPDCIRSLEKSEPIILRNPGATRPWQHVLEPLSGYMMLASRLLGEDGHRFSDAWNFGPAEDNDWPVQSVAEMAVRHWGNGEVVIRPNADGYHEAFHLRLDSSRARSEIGWNPQWSTGEAIARTIRWHKAWRNGENMIDVTAREIEEYCQASGLANEAEASISAGHK